jgi:hypothetical protein
VTGGSWSPPSKAHRDPVRGATRRIRSREDATRQRQRVSGHSVGVNEVHLYRGELLGVEAGLGAA